MRMVKCNKCGWVHFAVSRQYAEEQVKEFNDWFEKQPDEVKEMYDYQTSSLNLYLYCSLCGTDYKEFIVAEPGDCPDGVTLGPIIDSND